MREVNLASLDLNLVPALEALLRRRSVSRAAEEVGLSQPAMSRALARLRAIHDDPLLVRTATGYALTPRAQSIEPLLASATNRLRDVFAPPRFDPMSDRRTLRIAASDTHTIVLIPQIMARLAEVAPRVEVRVEAYRSDVVQRIESGALDLIFALSTTPLPPGSHSETVAEDRLCLVMRKGHPDAGKVWTLADYARYPHVGVALLGDGQSEIDSRLAAEGVQREVALVTPHFMAALATVAATNMVTTLSAALAGRFAEALGLVLKPAPFQQSGLKVTLVCSRIRAADPFLAWFRAIVRDVATRQSDLALTSP